jgi:hypothetical protein
MGESIVNQYLYRNDDGKTIEVSFERAINEGQIITHRGQLYRRVHEHSETKSKRIPERTEILSDSLGFPKAQLPEMQAHLELTRCRGVEIVQDKQVPEFCQVKCDSPQAYERYARSRGFREENSRNGGGTITQQDLDNARELVQRIG